MSFAGVVAALAVAIVAFASASAGQFTLKSATFSEGGTLPQSSVANVFGCTGKNVQPDLHWSAAPAGTKSFALTMYDPDAPVSGGFWHWVVFDIPSTMMMLNAMSENPMQRAFVNGINSAKSQGYVGPCPPPGKPHHYVFTLYALDVPKVAGADSSTTGPALTDAIKGHILGKAMLTGLYGR
jgi:Raf kinase inhibitor-like YbhB/YbcL family protein